MRRLFVVLMAAGSMLAAPVDCRPDPAARAALRAWSDNSSKTSFIHQRKSLEELAAKYPADFDIQYQRIAFSRYNLRDEWPGIRESYVRRAERNPSDPLALTLAGVALHQTDTPRAITLLTKALEISPGYPWAALKLAEIYQAGKFEDRAKARAHFATYTNACGAHFSRGAEWVMGKLADAPMVASIGAKLRARLDAESKPEPEEYEMLWSLEFRSRPPAEHPELRKQVSRDVERLLASKPDNRAFRVLLGGLKQSGASSETIAAFENRILREAAASSAAYGIAYNRWKKEHKEPEDHKDAAAWDAWNQAYRSALKQWAAQFTEMRWLPNIYREALIEAGELKGEEGVAAVEQGLKEDVAQYGERGGPYASAAEVLLYRHWAPAKALAWMEKALPDLLREDRRRLSDDTLTDEQRKQIAEEPYRDYTAIAYFRALKYAGQKTVPPSLRTRIEGPMPSKKTQWERRYRALAWLASVDGRDADALAYFQQALLNRQDPPKHYRGKLEDQLLDEAKAAFLKVRGTEKAFALWVQPSGKAQQLAEGRWEKPKKALPAFELPDLTGKTWKLAQLEGKAVLINLWATWCGPCRAELPHFQKLYEQTKDRSDIQVISFNVDEELGLVEPYMKENGYTFPALAAYTLVRGLFDGYGIPQNWLVDPKGNWLATQIGYDASDSDWVKSMLNRLEAAKRGKPPVLTE